MTEMNRFDDVKSLTLRTYNRVVLANNLFEDGGEEAAKAYFEMFSEAERKQMFVMQNYVRQVGAEEARRIALKHEQEASLVH